MTGTARGQALADRAMAWYSALSPKRREVVQDTALALALALLNVSSLVTYLPRMHPAWLALFLVAVQCAPLAIRRVNPVLATILVGIPRHIYDVLAFGYAPLPLAPAITFATVAERSRWWLRWPTLVFTAVGILLGQATPGHTEPYDAIIQYFIFGAAWAVGSLARSRRAAFATLAHRAEQAEAELDELAARAASAAAAERVRIARELHDVVAHHVSLMAVQAEATGALLPSRPEQAARSADLIAQTARQAMTELRRLLGVLRAPTHQNPTDYPERSGLAPSASLTRLDEVLAQVRGSGIPVSLTVSGSRVTLSPGIDLTAYRIVQEALTNTIRHAPGAHAYVAITYAPDSVTVQVTDSGPLPASVPSAALPASALPGLAVPGVASVPASAVPGAAPVPAPVPVSAVPGPAPMPASAVPGAAPVPASAGSRASVPGPAVPGTPLPNGSAAPDDAAAPNGAAPPSGAAVAGSNGDGASGGAAMSGPAPNSRLGPGFGLAGIAERVSSCGGTLTVGPSATGGFTITACLPVRLTALMR